MIIPIPEWPHHTEQSARLGRHEWSVARLITLSAPLPIMRVPLAHLHLWFKYKDLTLREFVMHMGAVQAADLERPIILDEDGEIMDGRHRIMRALLEGREAVLAVRFLKNPPPDRILEEGT